MKDHRNDGGLQWSGPIDGQVHRSWGLGLDPVAKATERSICSQERGDALAESVETRVAVRALQDNLKLGAVFEVVGERRQRDLGLAGVTIAKDQEAFRGDALG